ncbi:hypothetical protein GO491_03215 [Flavobacteriaceae bacterium Ap0902]|nr:hypothetical protein [Flavobacteriaceae bacterium Ap0902]
MKNFLLIVVSILFLNSCSDPKITRESSQEFQGALYSFCTYSSEATVEDMKQYVKDYSIDDQTTFFFFYKKGADISKFGSGYFSLMAIAESFDVMPPDYGFYTMPFDDNIYDDAIEITKYALE